MDLIRTRRLKKKIREFQKQKQELALDHQRQWTKSRFSCAKLWDQCKCIQSSFAQYVVKSFVGFFGMFILRKLQKFGL